MKHVVAFLIACLLGCGHGSTSDCDGSVTADPVACLGPLLDDDPASVPVRPLPPLDVHVAGIVASVLPPFLVETTCHTVVVGFAIGPAPCELPAAIDVVAFDAIDPLLPDGPAAYTVVPLGAYTPLLPTVVPNIFEVRLPIKTTHAPTLSPFVGAVVHADFCPAVMPACEGDPKRAMRYKPKPPSKGWHPLSQTLPGSPGTPGALYFGLADCDEPS